jgi:hypothetical protein
MIKSEELRIGNYYEVDGAIYKVSGIEKNSFRGEMIQKATGMRTNGGRRQPIELTGQILIKCGFSKNIDYKLYLDDCYLVSDGEEVWAAKEFNDMEFTFSIGYSYLHQLQNLYYCLTGKELEIKL